ncbi:MAG: hypothetical protein C7B47_17670 [Sulfobacillus thermosulfidooxidans]|uniref:Uncharacterized protein n=1 Tax=Sulfobacillus thermosulfidooxidans TaxID=28034 RepID=A0A2T2WF79_SULTH|nr:MAG: hypothetical protein C7B47_17670 [Sulfobacillus thermosulfidooxidans]
MEEQAKNIIYCARCADEIVSKNDLITVLQWPGLIVAYHPRCYGERAQGSNPAGAPLNSHAMIWLIALFSPLCLAGFVFSSFAPIWLALALIIPILRLLSWLLIERKVSQ